MFLLSKIPQNHECHHPNNFLYCQHLLASCSIICTCLLVLFGIFIIHNNYTICSYPKKKKIVFRNVLIPIVLIIVDVLYLLDIIYNTVTVSTGSDIDRIGITSVMYLPQTVKVVGTAYEAQ